MPTIFSCITTPIARGRPRKNPVAASSSLSLPLPQSRASLPFPLHPLPVLENTSDCPELNSEFVAHCFEGSCDSRLARSPLTYASGLKFTPQYTHPLISATSIKTDIRAASFQIHLLPPQSRVLALCIVCFVSLTSFHPSVLGDGPRPESFLDHDFFSSQQSRLLECGKRRAPAFRALRAEALKGAWEIGVMLQPSSENAASCYLLDLTELGNLCLFFTVPLTHLIQTIFPVCGPGQMHISLTFELLSRYGAPRGISPPTPASGLDSWWVPPSYPILRV